MKQYNVSVRALALLLMCALSSPSLAGITVTSYMTIAETNAYAPFSKAQYFDQQTMTNVSPALAQVSDDWTGTNVAGSTPTWHWIGASHAETTTTSDGTSLLVTGVGSFSYDMTTTSDFVNPIQSGGVYSPGGDAVYECYFTIDKAASYRATGQLTGFGQIVLGSIATGEIFFLGSNSGSFDRTGTIAPGDYEIRLGTGNGPPEFPTGAHHSAASGMFAVPNFTITIPEPVALPALISVGTLGALSRRSRRACGSSRRLR